TMSSLWDVTPESLVTWVGVIDDGKGDRPETVRSIALKSQLGVVQSRPVAFQMKLYSEVAAKYMPALADLFKQRAEPLSSVASLINAISPTPYFIRFLRSSAGEGLAALQAKRVADAADEINTMGVDEVGEIGQFLSTILLLQGVQDVAEEDKATILQHLPAWERRFPGRLAAETADRCRAILQCSPIRPYSMVWRGRRPYEG
ncbi:hypothetical protein C8R47DRAFT_989790, partial [Mycena vitilis]